MKVKCDHRSKFSNLSNWKEEGWKKSGLQRDSNPWPPRYRCDALPTELWSHTLGARSIYWVHFFPCSEIMWNIYEIIHICTANGARDKENMESQNWLVPKLRKKKSRKPKKLKPCEPISTRSKRSWMKERRRKKNYLSNISEPNSWQRRSPYSQEKCRLWLKTFKGCIKKQKIETE